MYYIIFTGTIIRMGGAQMYISNKVQYMKKLGWNLQVFSGLNGQVLLHNLEEYRDMIIPELEYFPNYYSNRDRERIVNKLLNLIGPHNKGEVVIESSTDHMAAWAEIVAEKLHGKHFAFLLDERFGFDRGYLDFFRFKLNRHELALISSKSLSILFGKEFVENEDTVLSASCNNVTEDISNPRFDAIPYNQYDAVICSLGRLNKEYIPTVISGFRDFAVAHLDKKIAYVFIGDQPEGFVPDMRQEIQNALAGIENVSVYQMGYVYPIPLNFFEHLDVGVASAGSSRVVWNKRIPTISMDAKDGKPIGILGYTTLNTLYHENEERKSLKEFLDIILFSDTLSKLEFTPYDIEPYDENFKKHMSFISKMSAERKYYDVLSVKFQNKDSKLKKMAISSLGLKKYKTLKAKLIHRG